MKQFFALSLLVLSLSGFSQSTYPIRADKVLIEKVGGAAELILKNATRDTVGVLYNKGGGSTEFRKTVYFAFVDPLPNDILVINSTGDTVTNRHADNQCQTRIVFGGHFTRIGTSHDFFLDSTVYYIGCTQYIFKGGTVTLDDVVSDPRIDQIIYDASGPTVLKGTEAADPAAVGVNTDDQLLVVTILINADNSIDISNKVLYDEGSEGTNATTGTANFTSSGNAQNGTNKLDWTAATNNQYTQITYADTTNLRDYANLVYHIRNIAVLNANRNISVQFYLGNTAVTNEVNLTDNGYTRPINATYQTIIIATQRFTGGSLFNRIRIRAKNNGGTFHQYHDNIYLEKFGGGVVVADNGGSYSSGRIDSTSGKYVFIFKKGNGATDTIGAVPKSSGGTGGGSSAANYLGTIFTQTSFSALTGFTNNGGTFSTSGGAVLGSSGAADFAQSLDLNYYTALEHYKINTHFKLTATGTNGFGIGIRGSNPSFAADYVAWFRPFDGFIRIERTFSTSSYQAISTAFSFSLNDSVEFSLERNGNLITATIRNMTTNGAPLSVSYRHDAYYGSSVIMQSTGKPAVFSVGGNFSLTKFEVVSNETKGADLAIVGDSKSAGYWAGLFKSRFADLLRDNLKISTVVLGGSGDRSTDWLTRNPELVSLLPKRVLLTNPSNDIRLSVTTGTSHSNYAAIVSALQSAGVEVFHCESFYESAQDNSGWNTYLSSTYPADHIITMYDVLRVAGALNADGIHPTELGNKLIYQRIISDGKLNVARGVADYPNPIVSTADGEALLKGSALPQTWLRFNGSSSTDVGLKVTTVGSSTGVGLMRADGSLFLDWWARDGRWSGGQQIFGPITSPTSTPGLNLQYNGAGYVDAFDGTNWQTLNFRGSTINFNPNNTTRMTVNPNGILNTGSYAGAYVAITGVRTLQATDYVVDCTSNSFTVTLPTAVGITGRVYTVKNSGAGAISIATTSSQTIDGSTTYSGLSTQYKYVTVQSTGANWIIIANN